MKKILVIILLTFGALISNSFADREGHMSEHMMGSPGYEESSGAGTYPCGMMHPGMMGHGGCGMMGPGMMNPGMMGHGGCGMMGRHKMMYGMDRGMMRQYGAEDYKKFLDDTKDLRKALYDRKFEYFEIARKPDIDREKLAEIEKDIWEIQKKLYEKWQK